MKMYGRWLLLFLSYGIAYGNTVSFEELLSCNIAKLDIARLCDVAHELALYDAALQDESNYKGCATLEEWQDKEYRYPAVHPIHQIILDVVKDLPITSVCEIGAGCGKVSKYISAQNPSMQITCVEHNKKHSEQIEENFQTRTAIIAPNIKVRANIVKDALPHLSSMPSNNYNLVFTCSVMMHVPFVVAVKSAINIVRLSNKYVLHVENKNEGTDWYNMVVVKPALMSSVNYNGIDYVKLYEKLGLKTIKHFEYKDPWSPATVVIYLGEKVTQSL